MNFLTVLRDAKTGARLQSFVKCANTLGISRETSRRIGEMFSLFEVALQKELGPDIVVETFVEDWHSAVLWSLVFFRPIRLSMHSPLRSSLPEGAQTTSVYEILACGGAESLSSSGLGVMFDADHDYLVVNWREALNGKGLLNGVENIDCWKKVLADRNKHCKANKVDANNMRRIAERHTWSVPKSVLCHCNYRRDILWQSPGTDWDEFSAFSLSGIDLVRMEAQRQGYPPQVHMLPPVLMECVRENVTDKEVSRLMHRYGQFQRIPELSHGEHEQRLAQMKAYRDAKRAARQDNETEEYLAATRIILNISAIIGTNRAVRRKRTLTGKQAISLFFRAADKLTKHGIGVDREQKLRSKSVRSEIDTLRQLLLLKNTNIPPEYKHWLQFSGLPEQVSTYAATLGRRFRVTVWE